MRALRTASFARSVSLAEFDGPAIVANIATLPGEPSGSVEGVRHASALILGTATPGLTQPTAHFYQPPKRITLPTALQKCNHRRIISNPMLPKGELFASGSERICGSQIDPRLQIDRSRIKIVSVQSKADGESTSILTAMGAYVRKLVEPTPSQRDGNSVFFWTRIAEANPFGMGLKVHWRVPLLKMDYRKTSGSQILIPTGGPSYVLWNPGNRRAPSSRQSMKTLARRRWRHSRADCFRVDRCRVGRRCRESPGHRREQFTNAYCYLLLQASRIGSVGLSLFVDTPFFGWFKGKRRETNPTSFGVP